MSLLPTMVLIKIILFQLCCHLNVIITASTSSSGQSQAIVTNINPTTSTSTKQNKENLVERPGQDEDGVCERPSKDYTLEESGEKTKTSCLSSPSKLSTESSQDMTAATAIRLQPQHYVTTLANVKMPKIIYGTAWKKDDTTRLVMLAIRTGFRGIDTACQPKHYNEPGVGLAIKTLIDSKEIRREDLFIQTKFTSLDGQDPNKVPYNSNSPLADQVRESLQISLKNLHTNYIDSIVLHGPMRAFKDTLSIWRVFESFYESGAVKQLGISNCYDIQTLKKLYDEASVKPAVIQNRLYKETEFDQKIRRFANKHGIYYQSFWTLTANPGILKSSSVREISKKYGKTPEQIFFAYLMNSAVGIVPLTGTSSEQHMYQDLEALTTIQLTDQEASVFDAVINSES